jgi:hypothetical protein
MSDPLRYVAPRTPTEEVLAQIWAEVLKLDQVGVEEDFFELGGHSLLIMRIPALVKRTLGRDVSIVDLFRYPVIRGLAAYLDGRQADQLDLRGITEAANRRRERQRKWRR